jgi:hypothetical protein
VLGTICISAGDDLHQSLRALLRNERAAEIGFGVHHRRDQFRRQVVLERFAENDLAVRDMVAEVRLFEHVDGQRARRSIRCEELLAYLVGGEHRQHAVFVHRLRCTQIAVIEADHVERHRRVDVERRKRERHADQKGRSTRRDPQRTTPNGGSRRVMLTVTDGAEAATPPLLLRFRQFCFHHAERKGKRRTRRAKCLNYLTFTQRESSSIRR